MKKLLLILLVCSAMSCKKDENKECNCGTITNDGVSDNCYWLEVRNQCSDNKKRWCFDQDIWSTAYVGSHFCVTNVTSW